MVQQFWRGSNDKLFVDCCYSDNLFVYQEKAANSSGCVANTKKKKTKQGVIKEIYEDGMIIERNSGEREIINLDFVTRIRQYPKKKNGKKKSVVLD